MKLKRLIPAIVVASGIAAAPVHAEQNSYVTRARVVESIPIIETVYEQKEVCHYEYVEESGVLPDNTGDKVIGGVIGGVAGSALGKGSGRDAAAGVGAVLGSEVAGQDGRLSEGELIGGVVGGIVGNQIGKGSGKTAATAAGALVGSIVGNNLQNGGAVAAASGTSKKVRVCKIQESPKKVITGYEVVFEHNDYHFSQTLNREPGDYIDINVNVEVLEDYTSQR